MLLGGATSVAALVASCGAEEGMLGDQGAGYFEYVCTRAGDAVCTTGVGPTGILPMDIALGSEFGARYSGEAPQPEGDVSFAVKVVPASPVFVEVVSAERFVARAAGHVALLGRGSNGVVADLVHVRIAPTGALRITAQGQEITELELTGAVDVVAAPLDAEGRPLAGALAYAWSASSEAVVDVLPAEGGATATLVPIEPGSATLTVTAGGAEATLDVVVTGAE